MVLTSGIKSGIRDTAFGVRTCSTPVQLATYISNMKKAYEDVKKSGIHPYAYGCGIVLRVFEENPIAVFDDESLDNAISSLIGNKSNVIVLK